MLFVKAAKAIGLGLAFFPLTGCAIGVGILYASLLKSTAYAPDYEDTLFNLTILGFAFIETFAFFCFIPLLLIYTL